MAEYVFQNVEGMLPELEEMERLELFTKDEIKCIVKRRTAFEYKLQRRIVQEADFIRYIQYELNVDLLRKRRKKKHAIQKKILPGEAVFIKRLHFLFQSALKKFPSDVKLWLQYVEFCKQAGSGEVLGRVVGRMLQAHPNNTSLWIMAAKHEFEDRNNIKTARTLLQRGLRLNPKCCNLWLEYFRLELLHVDKVKKRRKLLGVDADNEEDTDEPKSSDFMSGKTARIVFKNAIKSIPEDIEFRLKFVDIYYLFDDSEDGIDEVYQSLSEDFPNSEEAWNALAWRGLNKQKANQTDNSRITDTERLELESDRDKIFKEALKRLQTEKMWNYYIEAGLSDLERYSGAILQKKVNVVLQLFKSADKSKKLSEEKYLLWIKTLLQNGNCKEAMKVCKISLKVFPSSFVLLKQYFVLTLSDLGGVTADFIGEFCEAIGQLESDHDVNMMWSLWLELYNSHETSESLQRVYDLCINACTEVDVITNINESYLEVILLKNGIKSARKIYKRLLKQNTVALSFYQKCLGIEQSQVEPSLRHLRKLYETALKTFGSESPDLWLNYIRLEMAGDDTENVSKLHWRAMKSLFGENVEQFVTKYTLLNSPV